MVVSVKYVVHRDIDLTKNKNRWRQRGGGENIFLTDRLTWCKFEMLMVNKETLIDAI